MPIFPELAIFTQGNTNNFTLPVSRFMFRIYLKIECSLPSVAGVFSSWRLVPGRTGSPNYNDSGDTSFHMIIVLL